MNGATEEEKAAEEKRKKEGPFSIEEVLAAEAMEIHGDNPDTQKLTRDAIHPKEQESRLRLNEDRRAVRNLDAGKVKPRDEFYRTLHGLNRAALCLSGGGERSAVFCLGVIQALAACDIDKLAAEDKVALKPGQQQPEKSEIKPEIKSEIKPEIKSEIKSDKSLLGRFHYLSTVS